ncbi:hypothetical protein M877_09115 [Streptomyces niveus NCIMB 11891]|nr:hypothetical protein M877_09115 [Streptomyces niveus NCIMB 11891]
MLQERFGPPDILRLEEVGRPRAGAGQVLVRVHAAALNPYDWHMMRGDPYAARLMGGMGLTRPKCRVTALRGIRTVSRVRAGQRVLVNGAGGGVGTFAVQIAAGLDAEVTGVCGAGSIEMVRSLGATHVVDHHREDFTDRHARYDVILDNVGNLPLRRLRRALTPTGVLVANGGGSPGRVFGAIGSTLKLVAVNAVARHSLRPIIPATPSGPAQEDLLAVTTLINAGQVTPMVGRTYPLTDTAEAMRHMEEGHSRGKTVITVH